jgi:PAS domain S-box-containing protein
MLAYYVLAFLTSSVTLFLLRRQGYKEQSFLRILVVLMGLSFVGLVLSFISRSLPPVLFLLLQLVAWVLFLSGLAIDRRWIVGSVLVAGLLFFVPAIPMLDILSWGLLTAVPFSAIFLLQSQPAIPIFAPTKLSSLKPPEKIIGDTSLAAIQTQKPILECLTTGIISSGVDGVINYANQVAGIIVGIEPDDLIDHPVTDILTHLPMLSSSARQANSQNSAMPSNSFELNGRVIQGRMTIIYDDNGAAQGTVAILRDITSQFYAERSRDNFLTTISHELRTPLTAIKGYVELMASGTGGELTPNQQLFLQTIQRNVRRMVHLINSLIFASAVKGGRLEFTSDHTNMPQLIQQISREMLPIAAENGQQISMDVNGRLANIQADPMHVAIILEELIGNAIKYNKRGGKVRVQAVLQTDEANQNEFAVVSVSDEGVGIPPEMQTYIFDDFFHSDTNETQVKAGGVGMGLSVVRSLIDAYNGRIWLESKPNEGSTFFFLLPVKQPEEGVILQAA